MKASEFLKKYEREHGKQEDDEQDHSLQGHAKDRAQKKPTHLNAGTPFDWEDLERYQEELDRLDKKAEED